MQPIQVERRPNNKFVAGRQERHVMMGVLLHPINYAAKTAAMRRSEPAWHPLSLPLHQLPGFPVAVEALLASFVVLLQLR